MNKIYTKDKVRMEQRKIHFNAKYESIRLFLKENEFIVTWIGLGVTIISVMFANKNINNISSQISQYTEINQETELEQKINNNDGINNVYTEAGSILINNSQDSNVNIENSINGNYLNFIVIRREQFDCNKFCYFNRQC
jgi:hypothetical protein